MAPLNDYHFENPNHVTTSFTVPEGKRCIIKVEGDYVDNVSFTKTPIEETRFKNNPFFKKFHSK